MIYLFEGTSILIWFMFLFLFIGIVTLVVGLIYGYLKKVGWRNPITKNAFWIIVSPLIGLLTIYLGYHLVMLIFYNI